jgi:hypothetical protein
MPVSPFFGLGEFGHAIQTPECLYYMGSLHHNFSEICTKSDTVSDPSRNHIRPGTQLPVSWHTKRTAHPLSSVKFCTLTSKIFLYVLSSTVASRYYNCCIDGSTSPGKYAKYAKAYFFVFFFSFLLTSVANPNFIEQSLPWNAIIC